MNHWIVTGAIVIGCLAGAGASPAAECTALWQFEETGGSPVQDTVASIPLAVLGGTELNIDGKFGSGPSGVGFAPDSDGVSRLRTQSTGGPTQPAGDFTILMWIRPTAGDLDDAINAHYLIDATDASSMPAATAGYRMPLVTASDTLRFQYRYGDNAGNSNADHTRVIAADTWHLLAVRFGYATDGNVTINVLAESDTVDAAFVASNKESTATLGPLDFDYADTSGDLGKTWVGARQGNDLDYDGLIDDLAYFDGLLTDEDVAIAFNEGGAALLPPLATIVSFAASPSLFTTGATVTLSWEVLDADSVSIDQGVGPVAATGTLGRTPEATTTWTLTATRNGIPVTARATATLEKGPIDVYLLGGQSNMVGKDRASNLPDELLSLPEILLYAAGTRVPAELADTWISLQPTGLGWDEILFGPEIGLGERLRDLCPGEPIALIKYASGGTSLEIMWKPGADASDTANWGSRFTAFVNTVTNGLAALEADGWQPVIKGMLWYQGEQDAKDGLDANESDHSADDYGANLAHFIGRVREQFASHASPDGIRFVAGQVLPYAPAGGDVEARFPGRDLVRQAILDADEDSGAPLSVPNTAAIPTNPTDHPTNIQVKDGWFDTDEVHLSATALLNLGRSMAEAVLDQACTAPGISVSSPVNRQIVQRNMGNEAALSISGTFTGTGTEIQARAVAIASNGVDTGWITIDAAPTGGTYSATLDVTAGWYELDVRLLDGVSGVATHTVAKVGVGDIFVVAGQSNAGNFGESAQSADDDRVSYFAVGDGSWSHAVDPPSNPSGNPGSKGAPWPELGDLLAAADDVPIGFAPVADGGSSVQSWLPASSDNYPNLQTAVESFGTNGFRAVLWHQGEKDNVIDTTTSNYVSRLETVIASSRTDAGWNVPWLVALVSYNSNTDQNIIDAQLQVSSHGVSVFVGAATDDMVGINPETGLDWRYDGVHFANAGLEEHALRWFNALDDVFNDLEIVGASTAGNTFNASFTATLGRHYQVELSTNLTLPSWQTVTDIVSLATSPLDLSVPMTNTAAFYRIKLIP